MTKLLAFIVIFFFACKEKPNQKLLVNNQTFQEKGTQTNKMIYNSCEEAIIAIVKSSNAIALKNFKNTQVRINNLTSGKISIELYVSNDISENPAEKKVSENSVGWLEFFPSTGKLQDITSDPENPEILKYDTRILKNDISKLCDYVEVSSNTIRTSNQGNVKCYKKENNKTYTFSEICEYDKSINKEYLYEQILKKYNPEDLLKKIPIRDTTYSTSKVLKIQYNISPDTIKISQIFDGGETDYLIYTKERKGIIEERSMPD